MFFLILVWVLESPLQLGPHNLNEVALDAFNQGPGRAGSVEAEGLRDAAARVNPRLEELTLNVMPELGLDHAKRGEHNIQMEFNLAPTRVTKMRREVLLARAATSTHRADVERLQWVLNFQDYYAEAFLAHELFSHVRERYQAARAQEKNMKDQLDKQLIARADWLAQKALCGTIDHELRDMKSRLSRAQKHLERLARKPIELTFPTPTKPEETDENPFLSLVNVVSPETRLAEAMSKQADQEAQLALGERALKFSPNLNYRNEPGGANWLGLGMKLTLKTGPRKNAAWRVAQTQADHWRLRARWSASSMQQIWQDRADDYTRQHSQAAVYYEEVVTPLKDQLALFKEAHQAGHLAWRLYLQADRELHEAEHTYVKLLASLWSNRMEASAWAQLYGKGE